MKKIFLTIAVTVALMCLFTVCVNAAAPTPQKPALDVDFGDVTTIDGFTPPSQLYVDTDERVLLTDGNGGYVTYPTYYVTKDSTTFDMDFTLLNSAQSVQYATTSVVMLEVPEGVTKISKSYFAGWDKFAACLSVQIPGTVTDYGEYMFNKNKIVRIVEFLDGTEPVTMGNNMFAAEWNGGAWAISYVRFPNNLVSIGNNTFGKADGYSKTIIFGENLKSIGTGFFSQATPETKDAFLYVSDNFFAEGELFANLFGDFQQYHNNHLKLTIFYTGTQEKAQALVDKGLAVQPTGYIWHKAQLVSASEYNYETHNPKNRMDITIVYDYEKCDAFYGGHTFTGEERVVVNNYFETINIGDVCVNCQKQTVVSTIDPIFTWKGYSASTFGDGYSVVQGFYVNQASINAYLAYAPDFNYGILATVNKAGDAITPKVGDENVLSGNFIKGANDYLDIKVTGIPQGHEDTFVVFCVYVTVGDKIYYLDGGETKESVVGISYNDALKVTK